MASEERLKILEDSLVQDPDDVLTRYLLGMEYRALEKVEQAISHFNSVLERNPDYVPAHFMLAQCFEEEEEFEQAREAYELGITTATRTGDLKSAGEMQQALDMLDD